MNETTSKDSVSPVTAEKPSEPEAVEQSGSPVDALQQFMDDYGIKLRDLMGKPIFSTSHALSKAHVDKLRRLHRLAYPDYYKHGQAG